MTGCRGAQAPLEPEVGDDLGKLVAAFGTRSLLRRELRAEVDDRFRGDARRDADAPSSEKLSFSSSALLRLKMSTPNVAPRCVAVASPFGLSPGAELEEPERALDAAIGNGDVRLDLQLRVLDAVRVLVGDVEVEAVGEVDAEPEVQRRVELEIDLAGGFQAEAGRCRRRTRGPRWR